MQYCSVHRNMAMAKLCIRKLKPLYLQVMAMSMQQVTTRITRFWRLCHNSPGRQPQVLARR